MFQAVEKCARSCPKCCAAQPGSYAIQQHGAVVRGSVVYGVGAVGVKSSTCGDRYAPRQGGDKSFKVNYAVHVEVVGKNESSAWETVALQHMNSIYMCVYQG